MTVSLILALASMLLVTPDAGYAEYIDWDVLMLLFSLMAVVAGLKKCRVFDMASAFLMKMGGAVAGFAGPLILKAGGYAEGSVVTDKTIFVIQFSYILLPLIVSGVVLVLMKFFSLDKEYGRIQNS